MAFSSIDIVKGQKFEADFYVREDNGIEYKNLQGAVASIDIRNIDTKQSANITSQLTIQKDADDIWFVRMTIQPNITGSMQTIIEGADDRYLHRSPYYGILKIDNMQGEQSPVLVHFDKINVIQG